MGIGFVLAFMVYFLEVIEVGKLQVAKKLETRQEG